jgi:hypothetical protein
MMLQTQEADAMTLDVFSGIGLDDALLAVLIAEHEARVRDRLEPLWRYYRNEASAPGFGTRRRLAQESGLPIRITGPARHDLAIDDRAASREIVIENDIAWRVHTMVDFMFGKPVQILSTAPDEPLRRRIEAALDAVWEASGGISLFQDMALLGHVYGHVDLLVRVDDALFTQRFDADEPASFAELIRIEVIEPTRGFPIVNPMDYRRLDGFVVRLTRVLNEVERGPGGAAGAFLRRLGGGGARRKTGTITEIFSATHRQLYEDDRLIDESLNRAVPGVTPIVHIQNISQPLRYAGLGEVEPLIPLQDELNTRLSDRASRVTMQSFKMYLAKGIEPALPVSIGSMRRTGMRNGSSVRVLVVFGILSFVSLTESSQLVCFLPFRPVFSHLARGGFELCELFTFLPMFFLASLRVIRGPDIDRLVAVPETIRFCATFLRH